MRKQIVGGHRARALDSDILPILSRTAYGVNFVCLYAEFRVLKLGTSIRVRPPVMLKVLQTVCPMIMLDANHHATLDNAADLPSIIHEIEGKHCQAHSSGFTRAYGVYKRSILTETAAKLTDVYLRHKRVREMVIEQHHLYTRIPYLSTVNAAFQADK